MEFLWGNQETIKRALADIINPQAIHIDILITAIHELHHRNIFEMVYTISNMQLVDLHSKPHGVKILRDIVDRAIGSHVYPPSGS